MKRQQEPPNAKAFTHRLRLVRLLSAVIMISLPVAARAQKEAVSCGCAGFVQKADNVSPLRMLLAGATRISSAFGPRISPVFGTPEMHTGVDIAAPMGTPIHAAADGIISIAWLCGGYGNYVRIRHGNDTSTGYAHASTFARGIYSGVHVVAGQIIAYVGSTGLSTGPHLHFEVLVKGQPVRPACACTLTGP
jgi:murein DD-endopeptidase MepM/ murein hydrolase activator NlpD